MTYKRIRELHNIYFKAQSYYHNIFDNKFTMVMHSHKYIELMYCRSGEIVIEIMTGAAGGKQEKKLITLTEKQFILLDAGVVHKLNVYSPVPASVFNVEWEPVPYNEADKEINSLIDINVCALFDRLDGLNRFANAQAGYITALDSENLEHCLMYYIDLILHKKGDLENACGISARFIQVLVEMDKCMKSSNTGTGITYIKKAQEFIKNNFNRSVTVDEIAAHAGVNKAYLQRLFNAHTGMSIMQSLNNFRIAKCKRILIETNLTIDDICKHVGFSNRQHLIYEFKVQTGTTPTSYRNEYTNRSFRHTPSPGMYISFDVDGNLIE